MEKSKKYVLLIIELIAVAFLIMSVNFFNLSYNMYLGIITSGAFIIGYYLKRQESMLFCGISLFIISCQEALKNIPLIGETLFNSLIFITVGIFLIIFVKKRYKTDFFLPEYFLIWCGIYALLLSLPYCKEIAASLFFIITGIGFIFSHFFGKRRTGIWSVFIGFVSLIMAIFLMA